MNTYPEILRMLHPVQEKGKRRFGRNWDGGYILSQRILDASDFLISLGVGEEWSFEAACLKAKRFKYLIMVDDRTSAKDLWKQLFSSLYGMTYKFYNKAVFNQFKFDTKKVLRFGLLKARYDCRYIKRRIGQRSGETRIDQLIEEENIPTGHRNILLKMDIEGSEYENLKDIVNGYQNYSGVIVEFHDILNSPEWLKEALIEMKTVFEIIHVHYNNYGVRNEYLADVIEVTFINKSFEIHPEKETKPYPIPGLDFPCDREKEDYVIQWN